MLLLGRLERLLELLHLRFGLISLGAVPVKLIVHFIFLLLQLSLLRVWRKEQLKMM
jgi:hypothetical protein